MNKWMIWGGKKPLFWETPICTTTTISEVYIHYVWLCVHLPVFTVHPTLRQKLIAASVDSLGGMPSLMLRLSWHITCIDWLQPWPFPRFSLVGSVIHKEKLRWERVSQYQYDAAKAQRRGTSVRASFLGLTRSVTACYYTKGVNCKMLARCFIGYWSTSPGKHVGSFPTPLTVAKGQGSKGRKQIEVPSPYTESAGWPCQLNLNNENSWWSIDKQSFTSLQIISSGIFILLVRIWVFPAHKDKCSFFRKSMVTDVEQVSTAKHPQTFIYILHILHKKTQKESKKRGSSCHVMPVNTSLVSVCSAPASWTALTLAMACGGGFSKLLIALALEKDLVWLEHTTNTVQENGISA